MSHVTEDSDKIWAPHCTKTSGTSGFNDQRRHYLGRIWYTLSRNVPTGNFFAILSASSLLLLSFILSSTSISDCVLFYFRLLFIINFIFMGCKGRSHTHALREVEAHDIRNQNF